MNKKKSKNIYLAASPLQLMCIKEYLIKNIETEFELILFLHNTKKKNNEIALKQMFLTLDKLNLNKYKIFWIPKFKIIRFLFEILFIFKIKIDSINQDLKFIIFDFRNIFLQSLRRHFKKSKFTLIDDGFYTYVAQENYMKRNIFLPIDKYKSLEGKISKFLYYGFSYNRLKKTPIKLFTIYSDEISSPYSDMNNLNYFKEKAAKYNGKINQDIVFFTGTAMVERGALTLEQELDLIKNINKYWIKKNKLMYYVGKRSTSKDKLATFEDNNIRTLQFDLPLELIITERKEIPGNICTLGSTLQKSLKLIFDDQIKFYYVDIRKFFGSNKSFFIKINTDEVDLAATKYSSESSRITTIDLNH